MAIYRKKKFTSPKKSGRARDRGGHKSQKVGGPSSPIGSAANNNVNYKSTRLYHGWKLKQSILMWYDCHIYSFQSFVNWQATRKALKLNQQAA